MISAEDVDQGLRDQSLVVIDLRPRQEYVQGHLKGAISLPFDQLEARLDSVPAGKPLAVYCRGMSCVCSDKALDVLRAKGFEVRNFPPGYPEWRARELPFDSEIV
jgi:rhodanese-related sulfurtransferase